jgi:hypothetical protein
LFSVKTEQQGRLRSFLQRNQSYPGIESLSEKGQSGELEHVTVIGSRSILSFLLMETFPITKKDEKSCSDRYKKRRDFVGDPPPTNY